MYIKTLTYENFDGVKITEDFFFNLTSAELAKMQLTTAGGFKERIESIIKANDIVTLTDEFTKIIDLSYGIKSPDGKRFIKKNPDGTPVVEEFKQTNAYSDFYMTLITDTNEAVAFINGIMPKEVIEEMKKNPQLTLAQPNAKA